MSEVAGDARRQRPDLPFSLIYLTERASTRVYPGSGASLDADAAGGVAPSTSRIRRALARGVRARVGQRRLDLDAGFGSLPPGPWERPPAQALVVPIAQPGQAQPTGFFVAGLNPFRRLDAPYRSFIDLLVGQIEAGIANARAYEAERQRADALAEIDRAKTDLLLERQPRVPDAADAAARAARGSAQQSARALTGPELDTATAMHSGC